MDESMQGAHGCTTRCSEKSQRCGSWRPYIRYIVAVVLALVCEIAIFNAPHWRSVGTSEPFNPSIQVNAGLRDITEDESHAIDGTSGKIRYAAGEYEGRTFEVVGNEKNTQTLRIDTRNERVNFLTLNFSRVDRDKGHQADLIKVGIVGADAYNTQGLWLHSAEISPITPSSQRLDLVLSGGSPWVQVNIDESEGVKLRINGITVNERVPFSFNLMRCMVFSTLFMLIALLLPGSWIWRRRWNDASTSSWLVISAILLLHMGMMGFLIKLESPWFTLSLLGGDPNISTIYQEQLKAILDGHPWLNMQPPEHLINMEDPYDTSARNELSQTGIVADYAYFNGKYWCYFGVLPVVLFMLPVYKLTGVILDTWMMIAFCVLACVPASLWVVRALLRRYAPQATFGTLVSVLIACPALIYTTSLMSDQRTYVLPSALGLLLCLCACASWLTAIKDDGTLNARWIALGSLLMGMTLGARPTMSLSALLAIPLFWHQLRHGMTRMRDWIAMVVPPVIVAAPVLWWNKIRFGSWLDFGANYNLTNVNMTSGHPGLLESMPLRLFEILFRPIVSEWRWPFIFVRPVDYQYQGGISSFAMAGGYFSFVPIALLGLICAWLSMGRYTQNRENGKKIKDIVLSLYAKPLIIGASVLAFLLCLITSQIGGFSPRYDTDWAWILGLLVICGLALMDEHLDDRDMQLVRLFHFVVGMLALLSLLLAFWQSVSGYATWSSLTVEYMIKLRSIFMPS